MTLRLRKGVEEEITRRATSDGQWQTYLRILTLANEILDRAPQNTQECEECEVTDLSGNALEAMVRLLHDVFPGGLEEAYYYLPEHEQQGTG